MAYPFVFEHGSNKKARLIKITWTINPARSILSTIKEPGPLVTHLKN